MEQAEEFAERPRGTRARLRTQGRGGWCRPPTRGVTTLGEDGAAALKVEAYRPQPRARSPREPAHRLRSEASPPEEPFNGSL